MGGDSFSCCRQNHDVSDVFRKVGDQQEQSATSVTDIDLASVTVTVVKLKF